MKKLYKQFFLLIFSIQTTIAIGQSDGTPPVLNSVSVSPSVVNNGDSVTVLISITDDLSGINGYGFPGEATGYSSPTQARISNPSGGQIADVIQWKLVSGNTYSGKAKISNYGINGTWKVESVLAADHAGNMKSYQNGTDYNATFQVNSSTPDDTPPLLNNVSVSPSSINGGDSITVLIDISDNVAGVNGSGFPGGATGNSSTTQARISNSKGGQIADVIQWKLVSGNTYSGKAKISNYGINGTWKVESVLAVDHAGNMKSYQNGTDFNATFQVNLSTPDDAPPILNNVSVSPSSINAGDSITVIIDISDNVAGVNGIGFPGGATGNSSTTQARISNPSNGQIADIIQWKLVTGNTYSGKAKISEYAVDGVWKVESVLAVDHAGNMKSYANCSNYISIFNVGTVSPDINAPLLNFINVDPAEVNPGDSVLIEINLEDNESFVNGIGLPGYNSKYNSTNVTISNSLEDQQVSESNWNVRYCNYYSTKIKVPSNATPGLWKVSNLIAFDRAGNNKSYQNEVDYTATFQVVGTADIKDYSNESRVSIYPNPLNNKERLTVKGNIINKVVIFDAFGSRVLESDLPNLSTFDFSLNELSTGIYYVQIFTGNEIVNKKLLIK